MPQNSQAMDGIYEEILSLWTVMENCLKPLSVDHLV